MATPIHRYLGESSPRRPLLSINVPPPHSSSRSPTPTALSSPQSTSSASRSRRSSAGTEMSSAPTSATSISTHSSVLAMAPSYWLQCTFREIDCKLQFYPEHYEDWRSHCSSHLGSHSPPKESICIFCDKQFRGSAGWSKRMAHIAEHLAAGQMVEDGRPDFALYRHMYAERLLSPEDYHAIVGYSEYEGERERLGLKPIDGQPEKSALRHEVVYYDQRKEDRERAHQLKGKGLERHRS